MLNFIFLVCNPGYYYSDPSCYKCPGNKIKTAVSNAANCDADQPCDGTYTIPNAEHTACGKGFSYDETILFFSLDLMP